MEDPDLYLTFTPLGIVKASFGEAPGVALQGGAQAVKFLTDSIATRTNGRGMLLSVDTVTPADFWYFCQPEGSGISISAPPDVSFDDDVESLAMDAADDGAEDADGDDGEDLEDDPAGDDPDRSPGEGPVAEADEFDPEEEFEAIPDDEAALDGAAWRSVILDGDFPGHPFRGNQYVKAHESSGGAVRSSQRAKHAEKKGDRKAARTAHRAAFHSHKAAEASATTRKAKSYHRTMARFHKARASGAKPARSKKLDAVSASWHSDTIEKFRGYSDAQLRYVIKDATEAAEAGEKMDPPNPKSGQYRDEVHYAAAELNRRRRGGRMGDPYEPSRGLLHVPGRAMDSAGGGVYLSQEKKAIAATASLLGYLRAFIRSDKDLAKNPMAEKFGFPNSTNINKAQAQEMLTKLIDVAISRKGGEADLTSAQHRRLLDFQHDARVIDEYFERRMHRGSGRNQLRTPEMKAKYPEIDNPGDFQEYAKRGGRSLDSAAELPGLRAALRTKGGANFMGRLMIMRDIMLARDSDGVQSIAPSIESPDAGAIELLVTAKHSGAKSNAYTTAIAIVNGIKDKAGSFVTVASWSTAKPADVPAMDSVDLFGSEVAGQYLAGRCATFGKSFGTVYVRGDGLAMFRPDRTSDGNYWGEDGLRDKSEDGGDDWQDAHDWRSDLGALANYIAELGLVVDETGRGNAGNRDLEILNALEAEGWKIVRGTAERDDPASGELTAIEGEFTDPKDPITYLIKKTDDNGDRVTTSFTESRDTPPMETAKLLIQAADALKLPRAGASDAAAAALARLAELGWAKSQYADIIPTSMARSIPGVGPVGGMVVPDGARNFYAEVTDDGDLIAKLGDDILARSAVGETAESGRAAADAVNAAVEKTANDGRATNGLPPVGQQASGGGAEGGDAGRGAADVAAGAAAADTVVSRVNALKRAVPKGAITSDDLQAIEKLTAKLTYLQAYSAMMRDANKLVRKKDVSGLQKMGFPEKIATSLLEPDFAGRVGFPDYELKNTNAEARRTALRLEGLQAEARRSAEASADRQVDGDWQPFEYKGLRVSPTNVRSADGSVSRKWQVQTPENAEREKRGERQIGGDALSSTKEDAVQRAEEMLRDVARRKAIEDQQAAQAQAELQKADKIKAARDAAGLTEFVSGMSPASAARALQTLEKPISVRGVFKPTHEHMAALVAEGFRENQDGTRLAKPDGKFFTSADFPVTAFRFATFLADRLGEAAGAAKPAEDERAASIDALRSVIAGTHAKMLEADLADELVAILERYADDAEIQKLGDEAAQAYSNALLKATETM